MFTGSGPSSVSAEHRLAERRYGCSNDFTRSRSTRVRGHDHRIFSVGVAGSVDS